MSLILCDPIDYTVHGILQATVLEWVAFPFSRGSSQPRNRTQVSCIAGEFFTSWATRKVTLPDWEQKKGHKRTVTENQNSKCYLLTLKCNYSNGVCLCIKKDSTISKILASIWEMLICYYSYWLQKNGNISVNWHNYIPCCPIDWDSPVFQGFIYLCKQTMRDRPMLIGCRNLDQWNSFTYLFVLIDSLIKYF